MSPFVEGKEGWHGKAFKKGEETDKAIAELEKRSWSPARRRPRFRSRTATAIRRPSPPDYSKVPAPAYKLGDLVATREAWGTGLAALGTVDSRVVALDADVKNSTFSERFEKAQPERFFEHFIAEQVMVGAAMGLAARGAIPFPSTFACFLTRAADFIRMAGISTLNVKLAGSHAGDLDRRGRAVPDGARGPVADAFGPECAVLYPVRWRECREAGRPRWRSGRAWRTCGPHGRRRRSSTRRHRTFPDRRLQGRSPERNDVAVVIGAGVTLFEALKAHDQA